MARRRQTIADDIIVLTANMPWWVGLLLALTSYVILHRIAGQGLTQASGQDVFAAAKGGMVFAFASLGQYALPGLFGIGALVSIISRLKRTKLHSDVTSGIRGIGDISWRQFEELIGEHFRRSGYQVEETGSGADGVWIWCSGRQVLNILYSVSTGRPIRSVLSLFVNFWV